MDLPNFEIGKRQRLIACGLSEHYREIFEITRLADFISLAAEEESALNEAAQGIEQSS
jgi:anti-sigma B factor antagonist